MYHTNDIPVFIMPISSAIRKLRDRHHMKTVVFLGGGAEVPENNRRSAIALRLSTSRTVAMNSLMLQPQVFGPLEVDFVIRWSILLFRFLFASFSPPIPGFVFPGFCSPENFAHYQGARSSSKWRIETVIQSNPYIKLLSANTTDEANRRSLW